MDNALKRDTPEFRARTDHAFSLLSEIVNSSDDAIISKNLDGIISSWNPAAERMFGYSAAQAIGQSIRLIIPPELQAEEDHILKQIHRGERVDHFETERQTKDGRRLNISLTVSPVRDAHGVLVGASKIARDITEQKKLESERERARQQLAEALDIRDEFIGIAAHELRNPLNSLAMILELLTRTASLHHSSRSLIEKSRAQLVRLSSLVDRLMDVTRVRSGTLELYRERIDLNVIIPDIVSRFIVDSPESTISVELDPDLTGMWDRLRIDQVITNLISNAIKYGSGRPIVVRASVAEDHVTITVRDRGLGISPENLERVFERFERATTRTRKDGLGLGLWITKEIVRAHGGTVIAESELGHGSTFTVRLPLRS